MYLPIVNGIELFFQISQEVYILIKKYIFIRVFSSPAELILYVLVGLFLGLQKTFISSLIIIIYSILNIIISIILVTKFNLNVSGVAFGTLISSYATAIASLVFVYYFFITMLKVIPKLKKNLFNIKKIIKILKINFDIFIRTIFLTFAFLWINYLSSKIFL